MDMATAQAPAKITSFDIFCTHIAGGDVPTLRLCPRRDVDAVRAVAAIMICVWLYQTGLFAIIEHQLFARPGQVRPEFILISAFLATFFLLIESFSVMRSSWNLLGIEYLKRGGIDISGGPGARIKATVFLIIRILLSIGLAQLTAIFLSLLIFHSDISARVQDSYLRANAALIAKATTIVDGEIQRATEAVNTEGTREAALAGQVTTLRQIQIDPSSGDPEMQLAQQEVARLQAQEADADQAEQKAKSFASDELGGAQGEGHTGIAGDGPRRKAAMEAAKNADDEDRLLGTELAAARDHLDALRAQWASTSQTTKQQSQEQSPVFENALNIEDTKLATMKSQLADLTGHRDEAIRNLVEAAPDHVPADNGLLAQITILDHIAHENPKIAAVIILVDLTSFGFEIAAVLAKVTSYVPSTYAALLAREAYMSSVRIVDEMMAELNGKPDAAHPEPEFAPPPMSPPETPHPMSPMTDSDPFARAAAAPVTPAKRPRGRPPKVQSNGSGGLPVPASNGASGTRS